MRVNGQPMRSIQRDSDGVVRIIDQRLLPHALARIPLLTLNDAVVAIADMAVRGAPLIGATAAWGVAVHLQRDASDSALANAYEALLTTRPTAINLRWALNRCRDALSALPVHERAGAAAALAQRISDEDVTVNLAIGQQGLPLLRDWYERAGAPTQLNVLTHCNAGWLATVDGGTALAPIYAAFDAGLPVHVWVNETRPRGQGAALTAWELGQHGVPHTVIADNAGGHIMQRGQVHGCIVGTDRTTRTGDVCNKIGTYLKALAALDNGVPFYVALPSSTIDWSIADGVVDVPIEHRAPDEVTTARGRGSDGVVRVVQLTPDGSPALNPAFDVTPARLVTGLITERGVCPATSEGLRGLFPEHA